MLVECDFEISAGNYAHVVLQFLSLVLGISCKDRDMEVCRSPRASVQPLYTALKLASESDLSLES